MATARISLSVLGAIAAAGCGESFKSGEGYELSEVENEGESLDDPADDEVDDDSDDGDGSSDSDSDGDIDGDDDQDDEDTVDERTFAKKLVVSVMMPNVPFHPDQWEASRTTSLLLVDWVREGTTVRWTEELCDISASEVHGNQTSFPSAFVSTMPIREHVAVLSAAEVGASFSTDTFSNVDGADLDNPETDSLPTRSGDGRVWDQDSDGNPGITVHIDAGFMATGNIYLVQRSAYTYEGVVVAQDRVEVYVDYEQEQSILGASNPVLTMAEVEPMPNPDPTTSYAIFQQIDDGSDCGDVKRDRGSLFD